MNKVQAAVLLLLVMSATVFAGCCGGCFAVTPPCGCVVNPDAPSSGGAVAPPELTAQPVAEPVSGEAPSDAGGG